MLKMRERIAINPTIIMFMFYINLQQYISKCLSLEQQHKMQQLFYCEIKY